MHFGSTISLSDPNVPRLRIHPSISSQSDSLVGSGPATVLLARPVSPPRPPPSPASIPVSSFPRRPKPFPGFGLGFGFGSDDGFGSAPDTRPVWDTVKTDAGRVVNNLELVVFPNPNREDAGKALREWNLWGPFFYIVFLGLVRS